MKLALVLGKQQGSTIVQRLKGIKDNLNIDVFDDVPEFIDSALKRNSIYDRILVLSTKITDTTLQDLYNYWVSTNKDTQVVMLSKAGVDETKSKIFLDVFKTPVAATMLVDSTTVQLIAEAVLRPTADLTRDYGIKDFLNGEFDEDIFEEPKIEDEPKVEEVQIPTDKSKKQDNKEKRTFLGTLFGKKKSKNSQEPSNNTQIDESDLNNANIDNQDMSSEINQEVQQSQPISDSQSTESNFEPEVQEIINDTVQQESDIQIEPTQEKLSIVKNTELNKENSSPLNNSQNFIPVSTPVTQIRNDFTPEVYSVDEEFSAVEQSESSNLNLSKTQSPSLASDDLGNLGVGSEEDSYRQANETPKVVTQTVVKEVIRNTGSVGGNLTALNSLYSGRAKKIVVVTGDRGTGVTSTAYNLATTFAKKVDTLYFDCDIENHGLLSYIDYSNFKNYENTHMNGVKMCKTSQALDKCVISWSENLYMLTTDYSCDATVDELKQASEIVAERASDFGVVVVDCPVDKLEYISDLILTGTSVICVEGSKRGFMNMLCQFERSKLSMRFKRTLVARGNLFVTKCNKHMDLNKLVKYIKAIYEPESVDWLQPKITAFDGRLNDKLLNEVLEG